MSLIGIIYKNNLSYEYIQDPYLVMTGIEDFLTPKSTGPSAYSMHSNINSLRPGDAYMRHEKLLSFPEWRIYESKLLYFSLNAQESLTKQLTASMS